MPAEEERRREREKGKKRKKKKKTRCYVGNELIVQLWASLEDAIACGEASHKLGLRVWMICFLAQFETASSFATQ